MKPQGPDAGPAFANCIFRDKAVTLLSTVTSHWKVDTMMIDSNPMETPTEAALTVLPAFFCFVRRAIFLVLNQYLGDRQHRSQLTTRRVVPRSSGQ